jgi:hypothetical protein
MTDWFRDVLTRHGQAVTVRTEDGDVSASAFLQPVTERDEQLPDEVTGIGMIDGRLWLYLGQAEVGPQDRVLWNGMEFRVRSSRPYYIGEQLVYWWASLEQAREAAE